MDSAIIAQRIESILSDLSHLTTTLHALEHTDLERNPENYAVLATEAALRSERIACRMRHLLYASNIGNKRKYLQSAGDAHGLSIQHRDGVLEITMPALLPKKKQRQSVEFLTDPLFFALARYKDDHMLPMYNQCVVCFCHIYDKALPESRIRDYDNIEMKALLDVIATFLMEDDTGLLVDAFNATEIGDTECTKICVMSKQRFQRWLREREKALESISDF